MPLKDHFWFPKEPFSEKFLKEPFCLGVKNILIFKITFLHYKEPFLQWKDSMDVTGSS